jgi:hypothetical protein
VGTPNQQTPGENKRQKNRLSSAGLGLFVERLREQQH